MHQPRVSGASALQVDSVPVKLPRSVRRLLFGVTLVLAAGLGYGAYLLSRLAPVGTAYAAKTLCSGVFVAGREPQEVMREDILADNHPLLRLVRPSLDRTGQLASATFLGFAAREAHYRPGLGCTIALGEGRDALPAAITAGVLFAAQPAGLGDGLPAGVAGPQVDAVKLQAAVDDAFVEPDPQRLRRTRALLVLHAGRIVAQRYAPGFSADTPMLGWSMTKTVTGALIGVLVKQGRLKLEHSALLPEWRGTGDPRAEITLDQLLRMTSGLRFTEDHGDPLEDVALMLFARPDGAAYAIDKPLEVPPGTRWEYSSGTSNILSRMIRDALGSTHDYLSFPRRALFAPLGMHSAVIEPDASGTLVASSFMYASPLDWAKLGQFLLQDGVWHGQRLLPAGWVAYMATLTPESTRKDFGAHLWVRVPPPFNSALRPRPQLPPGTFHAVGHEGQFVSVVPSRQLVVVRLGLSRGAQVWDHEAFLSRLLEALR